MNSDDLRERLSNLEAEKHEAIFQLGMADGKLEAVRQIIADTIAEEKAEDDGLSDA